MSKVDESYISAPSGGKVKKIGARNISIISILGIAGSIAWAIENSWFNTFVFDEMTTSPRPIAWMVAVSAIVATLTTIIMGTLSDRTYIRWGRRKPYIVLGYIFWGIITAVFPMVAWIQNLGIAVVMVIIMDAVMTFFGSTANDAAFSAWLTDISHSSNRNRIQTLIIITALLANLIAIGAAGIIIQQFGYFIFFYGLGGIVTICGVIAQFIVKEKPIAPEDRVVHKPFWNKVMGIFSPKLLKENRILYLLFLSMAISGIASQISNPYTFIYIEHYLGFSKSELSLIGGAAIILSTIIIGIVGSISHKFNRKSLMIFLALVGFGFNVAIAFMDTIVGLILMFTLSLSAGSFALVVHGAWLQDKYPKGDIGRFQGIRMIFMVLIPMVIGPPIGAFVIEQFGIPISVDGVEGFIPTPHIFIVSAIASLLALIPLFMIDKKEGIVKMENDEKLV